MPSNTDNSGSARAARLRRISAARGPVPVIRPNIGSMALDAILGRELGCCDSSSPPTPLVPDLILINCGISPQTLNPSIEYLFGNNTSETVDLALTDNSGYPPIIYNIGPFGGVGPFSNLVSWQTDGVLIPCDISQSLILFSSNAYGCVYQRLISSVSYTFVPFIEPPPITIIIRDATNTDTTVVIPDTDPVGPFTNLISWRPDGCPVPL